MRLIFVLTQGSIRWNSSKHYSGPIWPTSLFSLKGAPCNQYTKGNVINFIKPVAHGSNNDSDLLFNCDIQNVVVGGCSSLLGVHPCQADVTHGTKVSEQRLIRIL